MSRITQVSLGEHFTAFVENSIKSGRFESTSDAVQAGLHLLEQHEAQLEILWQTLGMGEAQLDSGQGIDGEIFLCDLIGNI